MHTPHHHHDHRHGFAPFDDVEAFIHCAERRGGRHGGRHGHDGFRGGHRGGHFAGGRVFAHGELKLILLALIAEEPRHGYELIRTIEEMFDGNYAPSPGAVYPTLTLLEEMDYASVEAGDNGKKRYRITATGQAFLDENRVAVDAAMERMQQTARMYARMAAPEGVREAIHNLRHALRNHAWSGAEAKRVLDILRRAANDIVDGAPRE